MSVAFTEDAVRARTKTVTRRKGWLFLKPGDRLTLCRKVMGRKPDEPLVRIVDVEVISARREPLSLLTTEVFGIPVYGAREVRLEGFPDLHPRQFVQRFFIDAQGMSVDDDVTRIEWRYLDTPQ